MKQKLAAATMATLLALLALCGESALADVVTLANGDRLTGEVSRLRGGKLEFVTGYAGTVFIDPKQIASVETERDVTVILKDYTRRIGRLVPAPPGQIAVLQSGDMEPAVIAPGRVSALLPGRVTASDWRVTGRLNAGLSDSSGNTEVRRMNLDSELVARKGRDRWFLGLRGSQATDRGNETEANATATLKYDRFLTEHLYGYGGSTLEHDRFKDLRLRATLGGGLGVQILESARTNLALEAGLDRVRTDFFSAADQLTYAARFGTRFDHWLIEGWTQLFHFNQVYVGLHEASQSFARTQTGLRFPVRSGLFLSLQYNVDWDGDPAPDRRSVDRTLLFSVGYKW